MASGRGANGAPIPVPDSTSLLNATPIVSSAESQTANITFPSSGSHPSDYVWEVGIFGADDVDLSFGGDPDAVNDSDLIRRSPGVWQFVVTDKGQKCAVVNA